MAGNPVFLALLQQQQQQGDTTARRQQRQQRQQDQHDRRRAGASGDERRRASVTVSVIRVADRVAPEDSDGARGGQGRREALRELRDVTCRLLLLPRCAALRRATPRPPPAFLTCAPHRDTTDDTKTTKPDKKRAGIIKGAKGTPRAAAPPRRRLCEQQGPMFSWKPRISRGA